MLHTMQVQRLLLAHPQTVSFIASAAGPPHEPGRVCGALQRKSVVAVAAGREHALVATADGLVFSFGGGRAVLGRAGAAAEPALVTGALAGHVVQHVAAGEVSMGLLQAATCMVVLGCAMCGM
jgi:hypothetical protein